MKRTTTITEGVTYKRGNPISLRSSHPPYFFPCRSLVKSFPLYNVITLLMCIELYNTRDEKVARPLMSLSCPGPLGFLLTPSLTHLVAAALVLVTIVRVRRFASALGRWPPCPGSHTFMYLRCLFRGVVSRGHRLTFKSLELVVHLNLIPVFSPKL